MDEIRNAIEMAGAGHCFFPAFPVCLLILFILLRGRRIRFVVPGLLITLIVLNPLFYRYWIRLGQDEYAYVYWRLLWVVPVISVTACVVPCITERVDRVWIKALAVAAGVGLLALGGTFLYNKDDAVFTLPASNAAKLPQEVVDIADDLVSRKDNPRVAVQNPLGFYIRQYDGSITTMFGRDTIGHILFPDPEAKEVSEQLDRKNGDMAYVAKTLVNNGYDYLVLKDEKKKDNLGDARFVLLNYIPTYGIYKPFAAPDVVKKRNELGQVVSVTMVDAQGQPVNGDRGYATTAYEYDSYGNVIREFRTNVDGEGVANLSGIAGYEMAYDQMGHVVMSRNLDPAGVPLANTMGYAEVRRDYKGKNLVWEGYFDKDGNPVNRKDTLYASVAMAYDSRHRQTERRYYDARGELVNSRFGYARIAWLRDDDRHIITETYSDAEGNPAISTDGYASITYVYNENGRLATESYYGIAGEPVNGQNGYASVSWEYDGLDNIIRHCFLDAAGNPVVTAAGYAEVRRKYSGKNLTYEAYFGADGAPLVQPAGHVAISQRWEGDNLVSRTYLDADGNPMLRSDGYSRAVWKKGDGDVWNIYFQNLERKRVPLEGRNLATDIRFGPDGWSEWMTPGPNAFNCAYNLGYANLGPKQAGDVYTSQLEVEFKGVTGSPDGTFAFFSQGAQDGRWYTGTVWSASLVNLAQPPEDGVYRFQSVTTLTGAMPEVSRFEIGFRCDYWGSGSFRVRAIRIVKGDLTAASEGAAWSPGV